MKLSEWRKEIDGIDAEIVRLINQRAKIAKKIGVLKATAGIPIVDAEREEEILRNAATKNHGAIDSESMIRIFRSILRESRQIQIDTQRRAANGRQVL